MMRIMRSKRQNHVHEYVQAADDYAASTGAMLLCFVLLLLVGRLTA